MPDQQSSRPRGEQLEVWRRYLKTHAAITRQLDAELIRDHRISLSEFEVLLLLELAPERQMRLIRLAEESLVTRSGMTRLITRLEDRGLVERVRCPSDRRGLNARITDAGREHLRSARKTHMAGIDRLFVEPLGDEIAALGTSLGRLPESAEENPPDCDLEG